jgi:DNA-binding CsgD family transcriptional regulator
VTGPGRLVARARDALERADWEAAKTLFWEALEEEETAEALEGLATAAFFLDEPALILDARERAYAGYRADGRGIDAARIAIALAWDYRTIRGEKAVADGWLARARRLLDDAGPAPERGWLALREASFALPENATLATERCAEAEALGRQLGDVDLEMTAMALGGLASVGQGEIAAGMARLDEATAAATAGEMRDPIAVGLSCCYLIFACERVRDLERAGQWCQRLAGMAAGWNIRALRAVCRAHYGTVLMLRGEWERAEVELTEAAAALAVRPGEAAVALARLAELRRRQGRADEAEALIGRAEHHPLAVLCEASLALDRGDAAAAADGAARYLRLMGEARIERAPGLELLAEAHAVAGRGEESVAAARELDEIARTARTDPLLGAARHAAGASLAATGSFDGAREAFEDACELLGRSGLPFEAARARVGLALALGALGRVDVARRELGAACERLNVLGAASEARRASELDPGPVPVDGGLSARESEVLVLVAEGLTNRQIAERLTLSEHTVHRHVANILLKLDLSSRAAAAAYAARRGLAR